MIVYYPLKNQDSRRPQPMSYVEASYENAIIEMLCSTLGYQHIYGPDVARDYSEPLYLEELLPALRRINSGLPEVALHEAIHKL